MNCYVDLSCASFQDTYEGYKIGHAGGKAEYAIIDAYEFLFRII